MTKHRLAHRSIRPQVSRKILIVFLAGVLIISGIYIHLARRGVPEAPNNWQFISCDVGQGDMGLIRTGNRSAIAIDTGPDDAAAKACLKWAGIDTVPQVFITHDHLDHRGGLNAVCQQCTVITTGYSKKKISQHFPHADFQEALAGQIYTSGSKVSLDVLASPGETEHVVGDGESAQENNSSLVLVARFGSHQSTPTLNVLLTGDIEAAGVEKVLPVLEKETINILKVPHHGSKYSGTKLENQLKPVVGIVSASQHNSYGHPHPEILKALENTHTRIFQTSESGHIAVVLAEDGNNMQIIAEKS